MCGVNYDHRVTLHDHIFTAAHISHVKKLIRTDALQMEGSIEFNASIEAIDKDDVQRTRFSIFLILYVVFQI